LNVREQAHLQLGEGLDEGFEALGIPDGHIGQDLAVQLNITLTQGMHELRVTHAVLPGRGVDPGDPETAELALALAPIPIGIPQGLYNGILGCPEIP